MAHRVVLDLFRRWGRRAGGALNLSVFPVLRRVLYALRCTCCRGVAVLCSFSRIPSAVVPAYVGHGTKKWWNVFEMGRGMSF